MTPPRRHLKKLFWVLAGYMALWTHDGKSQTLAPVLTAAKMTVTVSHDMRTLTVSGMPMPLTITASTSSYPAMLFITAGNQLRVASRATVAGAQVADANPMTGANEIYVGGATAYSDRTWHSSYTWAQRAPTYLTWSYAGALDTVIKCPPLQAICTVAIVTTTPAGYHVFRSDLPGGTPTNIGGVRSPDPSTVLFYFDRAVLPGHRAYYRVAAYDAAGVDGLRSNEVMVAR